MKRIVNIPDSVGGRALLGAGAAFIADGIVQIIHSQHSSSKVVGVAGHLNLALFISGLLLLAPGALTLGRRSGTPGGRRAGLGAAAGAAVLGLTCIVSLVRGSDPSFFVVVAPVTNLAIFGGFIGLAVALRRTGVLPRAAAIALPISWPVVLIGATHGLGLIGGAYLAFLGLLVLGAGAGTDPEARELVAA